MSMRSTDSWYADAATRVLAEDLASEVFLQAWQQRDHVHLHDGSLRPWLYGVASNLVRQHWRSRGRFGRAMARLPDDARDRGHADLVAASLDDRARLDELRSAVDQLPATQAEVLFLRVWEGLDYESMALTLNLPVGTVRSRLFRARARLRALVPATHHRGANSTPSSTPHPSGSAAVATKDAR